MPLVFKGRKLSDLVHYTNNSTKKCYIHTNTSNHNKVDLKMFYPNYNVL